MLAATTSTAMEGVLLQQQQQGLADLTMPSGMVSSPMVMFSEAGVPLGQSPLLTHGLSLPTANMVQANAYEPRHGGAGTPPPPPAYYNSLSPASVLPGIPQTSGQQDTSNGGNGNNNSSSSNNNLAGLDCDLFDAQGELFGEADLTSWLRDAVDNDPLKDWMDATIKTEPGAESLSDQDSVPALGGAQRKASLAAAQQGAAAKAAGGMSRAISMPNVMLAGLPNPTSPTQLPLMNGAVMGPPASMAPPPIGGAPGMPRSLSSGCLLTSAASSALSTSQAFAPPPLPGAPMTSGPPGAMPAGGLMPPPPGFLTAQAVMSAPSIVPAGVGPPTAVWHAQMGLTPRRKGKGGRQPANDPRLDPSVDPKKARRIVANRISAAKSKLKQKSEIEVLRAQLSEVTQQRDTYKQQFETLRVQYAAVEESRKQLQSTVQILQEVQQVHEVMTKKLQCEIDGLKAGHGSQAAHASNHGSPQVAPGPPGPPQGSPPLTHMAHGQQDSGNTTGSDTTQLQMDGVTDKGQHLAPPSLAGVLGGTQTGPLAMQH